MNVLSELSFLGHGKEIIMDTIGISDLPAYFLICDEVHVRDVLVVSHFQSLNSYLEFCSRDPSHKHIERWLK